MASKGHSVEASEGRLLHWYGCELLRQNGTAEAFRPQPFGLNTCNRHLGLVFFIRFWPQVALPGQPSRDASAGSGHQGRFRGSFGVEIMTKTAGTRDVSLASGRRINSLSKPYLYGIRVRDNPADAKPSFLAALRPKTASTAFKSPQLSIIYGSVRYSALWIARFRRRSHAGARTGGPPMPAPLWRVPLPLRHAGEQREPLGDLVPCSDEAKRRSFHGSGPVFDHLSGPHRPFSGSKTGRSEASTAS